MLIHVNDAVTLQGARALRQPLIIPYGIHQEYELQIVTGHDNRPVDVESRGCVKWTLTVTPSPETPTKVLAYAVFAENIATGSWLRFDFAATSVEMYKHVAGNPATPAVLQLQGFTEEDAPATLFITLPVALVTTAQQRLPVDLSTALMQELQLAVSVVGAAQREISKYAGDSTDAAERAEQAAMHAHAYEVNAEHSATAAGISAGNARDSEQAAEGYAIAAAGSASEALVSAEAAHESEVAAKASEDAAAVSASNAHGSEVAAKDSEDAALASQNAAHASEQAAATSEQHALASENAAKASEQAAAQSAATAATHEGNAAASATAAAAYARAAATSETNADASDTSAQLAAQAAEYARNGAVDAKVLAETAQSAAESAATDAADDTADAIEGQFRDDLSALSDAVNSAQSAATAATASQQSASASAVSAQQSATEAYNYAQQAGAIHDSILEIVANLHVGPATDYGLTKEGTLLSFTWTDPSDNDAVRWMKTRLVYKQGGFPANENDGTILIDSTVRNQHQTTPFVFDMLAVSDYYFALFTQTTGGVWNTGDDCPRFTTDELTWQTIAMLTRAGTLLSYQGMAIGSVVDIQTNTLFPKLRWKLAHIDYAGTYPAVSDFMLDNTRVHNSIWIPDRLLCLGTSNDALMVQFDAPENSYGATWDTVFINGKAYYIDNDGTYEQLTVGTDYENGDDIAAWQMSHLKTVYTKNHANRVSNGCNSWMMSNLRQGLNKQGANLYVPQNEYDVKSSNSFYNTGFLAGFSEGYLATIMQVRNKTARNTVSAVSGGGGGGSDITLDKFWAISLKEFNGTNSNNIAEGQQFAYFRDVATTNAQRIQIDEGGTARAVWMRSANVSSTYSVDYINTSGASNNYNASLAYALLPAQCVA